MEYIVRENGTYSLGNGGRYYQEITRHAINFKNNPCKED